MRGYQKGYMLVSILFLGCVAILIAISAFGWAPTWYALNVPAMLPHFADMRTVQGALDTVTLGLNPQVENPGDPWGREMNYPKIWLYIADAINLQNERSFTVFTGSFIFAYLICCALILTRAASVLILALIFSGASLLAIERGNSDLLIFSLLFIAANVPAFVGAIMICLATALKIFPFLAAAALLHARPVFIGLVLANCIIFYVLWSELAAIQAGTPVSGRLSYGSASIAVLLTEKTGFQVHHVLISVLLALPATGLFVLAPDGPVQVSQNEAQKPRRLFMAGAAIYCGTFVLASNWDYRLIFLILCVPYIVLMRSTLVRWSFGAAMLLASNQIFLMTFNETYGLYLNILAKSLLFVGLVSALLFAIRTQILERNESGSEPDRYGFA